MENKKFVIKLESSFKNNYYSHHGAFAGMENVVSQTTKKDAKIFDTFEEASDCIQNMPEWTKKEKYYVEELSEYESLFL
jgi:hypothetical protein